MKTIHSLFLVFSVLLLTLTRPVYAIEFNSEALEFSGNTNIDLTRFETSGLPEGDYWVGFSINGRTINTELLISFIKYNNEVQPCIPDSVVLKIGLEKAREKIIDKWNDGQCNDISSLGLGAIYTYDNALQNIDLKIPNSYLAYSDPDWVPAAQRDYGIGGVFVDYHANFVSGKNKNAPRKEEFYSYGTAGANLSAWRLRADYQYREAKENGIKQTNFNWSQVYAFRDLPTLSAKLVVGETFTQSSIYDATRFKGISLYSDENMMPSAFRGYSPEVSGIAETDALVTVMQDQRVLVQERVAAGPFRLQDLNQHAFGMLDVKVEESNGQVREFKVYANSIPFLTRYKQFRYQLNIGKISPLGQDRNPDRQFTSSEISYGLTNTISIYGGVNAVLNNSEYQAYTLGLGSNLGVFGALSFDVTRSNAKLSGINKLTGNSYRINYAKSFENTGTQFNFIGYRFSDRTFITFNNYVSNLSNNDKNYIYASAEKSLLSISIGQKIPRTDISLSLNLTENNYWSGTKSKNYSLYLSKTINSGKFRDLNIMFSGSRYDTRYERYSLPAKYNVYYLSFSYPLGKKNTVSFSNTYRDDDKLSSPRIDLSGWTESKKTHYYLSAHSEDNLNDPGTSATLEHKFSAGTASIGASQDSKYKQFNMGMKGSITATRYGVVAHQKIATNNSRVFLDTEGQKDVVFDSLGVVRTNRLGVAVADNVTSYQLYQLQVNSDLTNTNVAADNKVYTAALVDGAIGYQKVETIVGDQLILKVELANRTSPPFGAIVQNKANGREVGMISDNGLAYVIGISKDSILEVKWFEKSCEINIAKQNYELDKINLAKCL